MRVWTQYYNARCEYASSEYVSTRLRRARVRRRTTKTVPSSSVSKSLYDEKMSKRRLAWGSLAASQVAKTGHLRILLEYYLVDYGNTMIRATVVCFCWFTVVFFLLFFYAHNNNTIVSKNEEGKHAHERRRRSLHAFSLLFSMSSSSVARHVPSRFRIIGFQCARLFSRRRL